MAIKCDVYVKANLPNFALDFGVLWELFHTGVLNGVWLRTAVHERDTN